MNDDTDPDTTKTRKYVFSNPYITMTFDERPEPFWLYRLALLLSGVLITVGLVYLYAIVLFDWIGFERTVLVGIALLLIGGLTE